jgi:hypothetical protein
MGVVYIYLSREAEAETALIPSLEKGLPPILLTSLNRMNFERPDFYQRYIMRLLAREGLVKDL